MCDKIAITFPLQKDMCVCVSGCNLRCSVGYIVPTTNDNVGKCTKWMACEPLKSFHPICAESAQCFEQN